MSAYAGCPRARSLDNSLTSLNQRRARPPGGQGNASVDPVASFCASPSASNLNDAWFEICVPAAALIVALIVIVTLPPAGMSPSHVTVLTPIVATAVPDVAADVELEAPAMGR